jgi:hypothetical protein
MWITQYNAEVKKYLRDVYKFKPDREVDGEPCFNKVPDGIYPMTIGGKDDLVVVSDGKFHFFLKMVEHPKVKCALVCCVESGEFYYEDDIATFDNSYDAHKLGQLIHNKMPNWRFEVREYKQPNLLPHNPTKFSFKKNTLVLE